MNKPVKRLLAALLAFSLLLAGCGASGDETENEGGLGGAKGRFMEEQFDLPAGLNELMMFEQDESGKLYVVGSKSQALSPADWSYHMWTSTNQGRSWDEVTPDWLSELTGVMLQNVTLANDGGFYMLYYKYTDTDLEEMAQYLSGDGEADVDGDEEEGLKHESGDDLRDRQDEYDPEAYLNQYFFAYATTDGDFTEFSYHPPVTEEYSVSPQSFRQAENGDLVLLCYFYYTVIDSETGELKTVIESDNYNMGDFLLFDDSLVVADGDKLNVYSLRSGSKSEEFTLNQGASSDGNRTEIILDGYMQRVIHRTSDGVYFYADATGIYRKLDSTIERILDGDLVSLAMPSLSLRGLFPQDDSSYLVLANSGEEGYFLLRYTYDAEMPSVPTTELKVYSLEDNQTIRQAVSMFQRQNPDIKVAYTVGMTGDITASDALRTLSTELLADSGPDVLVLDGMPVDSYIEKGALLDLTDPFAVLLGDGTLLPNVAGTYRDDSGLWAIPARFSVPMIQGPNDALAQINDITSLADWLEAQENPQLTLTVPEILIREYYPLLAPTWFSENGTLNEENFRQSLSDLERLSKISGMENNYYYDYGSELSSELMFGSLMWIGNYLSLNVAHLDTLSGADAPDAANQIHGDASFRALTNAGDGVIIPRTTLGVNAASAQTDLAIGFVEYTLSRDVLVNDFSDGMPVNRAALLKNAESPYEEGNDGYYISYSTNDEYEGEGYASAMQIIWPSEEVMNELISSFEAIETVCPENLVIRQMVIDETAAYFAGTASLDDAVQSFRQKIDLYLAE